MQSVSVAVVENFEIQQLVAVAVALKMGKKPDPTGLSNTNRGGRAGCLVVISDLGERTPFLRRTGHLLCHGIGAAYLSSF